MTRALTFTAAFLLGLTAAHIINTGFTAHIAAELEAHDG